MSGRALVTGGGGFIGSHLVTGLRRQGWWVRAADLKPPEFGASDADDLVLGDLRDPAVCRAACDGIDEVYALAADMGGMGFISAYPATILRNNALIDVNTMEAARAAGVRRCFFASSACVYPEYAQASTSDPALRERDAFPAQPQDSYGWEKLTGELLFRSYADEFGMEVRIARYHNVYGPRGTYDGGREKAPAALCRKVASAPAGGTVEVWGDGAQTRSFCYIDDCVEGTYRLMRSPHDQPVNIGSDRLVTIDELARIVLAVAGREDLSLTHVPGPLGVRGRNSDNTLVRRLLGWAPGISLEDGLAATYDWVRGQLLTRAGAR